MQHKISEKLLSGERHVKIDRKYIHFLKQQWHLCLVKKSTVWTNEFIYFNAIARKKKKSLDTQLLECSLRMEFSTQI